MELMHGASVLSRPAEEFGNDSLVEELWAIKAMEHAELHFSLITSVCPRYLRLSPYDDQIYETFRSDFKDMPVDIITDKVLKSPEAKQKWREFSEKFNKLEDFSYGTLMRGNSREPFSPDNSLLVVRVQFLAIEIARNREGLNDAVYRTYRAPPRRNDDESTEEDE